MNTQVMPHTDNTIVEELRQCASLLAEKLQSDNYEEASELIHNIMENREKYIFQSVGQLTRGLHDAIVNFNVDSQHSDDGELNDASSRLEYVIKLTQDAADKTMDKVEACTPLSMKLGEEACTLKKEWSRLRNREMSPDEFRELYQRLDVFFESMEVSADQLNDNLQSIILEQGFQDLTGQVLKKVISLVTEVESQLVELMRVASEVEHIVGIETEDPKDTEKQVVADIVGEGPQHKAAQRDDVVNGQDDVDDLLSSLGF